MSTEMAQQKCPHDIPVWQNGTLKCVGIGKRGTVPTGLMDAAVETVA